METAPNSIELGRGRFKRRTVRQTTEKHMESVAERSHRCDVVITITIIIIIIHSRHIIIIIVVTIAAGPFSVYLRLPFKALYNCTRCNTILLYCFNHICRNPFKLLEFGIFYFSTIEFRILNLIFAITNK